MADFTVVFTAGGVISGAGGARAETFVVIVGGVLVVRRVSALVPGGGGLTSRTFAVSQRWSVETSGHSRRTTAAAGVAFVAFLMIANDAVPKSAVPSAARTAVLTRARTRAAGIRRTTGTWLTPMLTQSGTLPSGSGLTTRAAGVTAGAFLDIFLVEVKHSGRGGRQLI